MRFPAARTRSRKGGVDLTSRYDFNFVRTPREILLFFLITGLTGLAMGLSDGIFSNYFKDVYDVDAMARGLIEFPRELPGLLCLAIISAGAFLGDVRMAILAQALMLIGITVLGLVTPPFAVMLIFLFINSLGMHMYLPLNDSIGMSLVKDGRVGSRLGQFNGIRTATTMVAGLLVFFGFRYGFFSFSSRIILPFLLTAILLAVILVIYLALQKQLGARPVKRERIRLVFKKRYRNYYFLAVLNGAHKQIMAVFGPWVLIELLHRKADTLAMLGVMGAAIGIFFMPLLGKWVDRFGPGRLMTIEGTAFISVYLAYGLLSRGFSNGTLGQSGWPVFAVFALFALNRMAMQFAMIRVVYLRQIAEVPEDITPTLSTGVSMDHVVSITLAAIGGWAWIAIGPEYVFYVSAALSILNVIISIRVTKETRDVEGESEAVAEVAA